MISINKSAYLNREASPLAPCLMNALVSENDINESLIEHYNSIQNVTKRLQKKINVDLYFNSPVNVLGLEYPTATPKSSITFSATNSSTCANGKNAM